MQSEYIQTVPPPPQFQQSFVHHGPGQGGPHPLHSGAVQIQQRDSRHPEGSYQYQDPAAITSPDQAYNSGIATQQQWPNSSQPAQERTQSWLSSAASSNSPPPSYAPTSSYNPRIYGSMSGVQQPPVGPLTYRARLSSDTSMWGVRYNQQHDGVILGQTSKPSLPPRLSSVTQYAQNQYVSQSTPPVYTPQAPTQQPQLLTSYNLPSISHNQGSHEQDLPPPPPPKTPQYHQDPSVVDQPSQSPQSMYHHLSSHQLYHSNVQGVSQYVEEPRYEEYHRPDSYYNTSPSPPQFATSSYHPSAPAYNYQDSVHNGSAQPLYSQPLATPSSPSVQRRNKWASIGEQTYPPIVSSPLPDHDVLVYLQDTPSTVVNTIPPSPTSTLDYEPQPQAHHVPNGPGWTQQPGVYRSFDHRICQNCGQQKSDQGACQCCGNVERSHVTGQYMQGHVEPSLQQKRNSENQSMTGQTQGYEDVPRPEAPHTLDALATNTHRIPDVTGALDTDTSTSRASVGTAGVSAASALGHGGPSDWEHFGVHAEDEIDDTYLFSPKQNVVVLPTHAAELPSKLTPPPNMHEQDQANQSRIEPEQVPLLSPPGALPAEASSSKASQLNLQTKPPPLPVSRTGPVPPTRSTSAETFTPFENSQSSRTEQQKNDETSVPCVDKSEVSTGEMVAIRGTAVLSIQSDVVGSGDLYQQQATSHAETNVPSKQVESGHIEAQPANQIEPKPTASQAIVLDSEEEFGERPQYLSSVDPLKFKPAEHGEKNEQHQPHDPYSDLDSWAKASLSRFVVMLRSEASASTDKEKLHVFTSFMSKESLLRAVLYGALPDLSADGTNSLAQPALEVTRVTLGDAKPSSAVLTPPQGGLTPSRLVDAPLSHRDTHSLPEVRLAAAERSVSPGQSPAPPTTHALVRTESSPHPVDPLESGKDRILIVKPEPPNHDQESSPHLRDVSTQREKPSMSDIGTKQSRRELTKSHEPTPLDNLAEAASQPIKTRKEQSSLAISIPDPREGTESEDDIEYSPGGRPIVSRPSRGPTRGQQVSKDDPRHASPSQRVARRASATPSQHNTASHSSGADAPIVVDIAGESQTSVRPTAGAGQRTSTPMLPAVSNERPAYAPNRHTESFSSAFEPQPFSQSKYKAYSAPEQTSLDGGITVRTESPDSKGGDALALASQQSEVHVPRGLSGAIDALRKILPAGRTLDHTTRYYEKVAAAKHEVEDVLDDFGFIKMTVVAWDSEAKKTREKNERDRRLRQEQSEERIDGLFHDNEIGYSDIGALEAEYRKIEAGKRAQEERDEQESFVRNVFEVVTSKIEREINHLSNHYSRLIDILGNTVACRETFNLQEERPEISQVLEVVLILQAKLEVRHRKVVEAALEKDRRFRKTQLAPLYTEGKVTEMKKLEKRFDLTERELVLEAARRRDERANELIHTVDEHSLRGIKDNQEYTKTILGGIRAVSEAMFHDLNMDDLIDLRVDLILASSTLSYLLANSLRLTRQSNAADIILNDADYEVSVAEAKVANADGETFKRLKEEKEQEHAKLKLDLEQRVSTVKTDSDVATGQIEALVVRVKDVESNGMQDGGSLPQETNFEHESRMQRALEETKERNSARPNDAEDDS